MFEVYTFDGASGELNNTYILSSNINIRYNIDSFFISIKGIKNNNKIKNKMFYLILILLFSEI